MVLAAHRDARWHRRAERREIKEIAGQKSREEHREWNEANGEGTANSIITLHKHKSWQKSC